MVRKSFFKHFPKADKKARKLLILDRATTHYEKNLVNLFDEHNSSYILIPPGLTRFIQPLDISINGSLKKDLKTWDTKLRIETFNSV